MDTRYAYIRDPADPRWVLTVARTFVEIDGNKRLLVEWAVCNPLDNFSRRIGRQITDNRTRIVWEGWQTMRRQGWRFTEGKEDSPFDAAVSFVARNGDHRARGIAKRFLRCQFPIRIVKPEEKEKAKKLNGSNGSLLGGIGIGVGSLPPRRVPTPSSYLDSPLKL